MSRSTSRVAAFAGDINPKPTFCVGDILLSRRADFYQVVRSDHLGARVKQLASRPDNTPRIYRVGNTVIVATGFKWPLPNSFLRHKRSRRAGTCWQLWDGRAVPADFNLEPSGLS